MTEENNERFADLAADIVEDIKPLLAGHPPELQGAVVADLLALWLVGMPSQMREEALTFHLDMVRQFVTVEEALMFGPAGHPDNESGGAT